MRRLALLLGLIVFVLWLDTGGFGSFASASARAAALEGETDPHWGCVDNQCVEIYACGIDDCSACPGCDPAQESACLSNGGSWDPVSCTCTMPTCYESDEQACINDWGQWDPSTCTCWNACNAGSEVLVWSNPYTETFSCIACNYGSVNHGETNYYERYCEDGRVWDSWTIDVGTVYDDYTDACFYLCS